MAVAVVVAVVAGVSLAVLEPAPSRPAEHRARDHAGRALHGPARPKTIVMVVFDELPLTSLMGPGERIDASRYPAFGRLARDATWYRRATAVHVFDSAAACRRSSSARRSGMRNWRNLFWPAARVLRMLGE